MSSPATLFPKTKGWSGSDLIDNAKILGYELRRIRGDHFILFHPLINDTVVIPKKDDMRRLDSSIVKQLRRAEKSLQPNPTLLPPPVRHTEVYTIKEPYMASTSPTKGSWFDAEPTVPRMTGPVFKGSWFAWIKSVRMTTGLSQKATAELFVDPPITEALLALVEVGKRKFSEAEYIQWKSVFDVTNTHPDMQLAGEIEMQRRDIWHRQREEKLAKIKAPTPKAPVQKKVPIRFEPQAQKPQDTPTAWFSWVRSIRLSHNMTLRAVVEGAGLKLPPTSMHDVERGHRKFRANEWVLWSKFFGNPTPPMAMPIADAASEKARESIKARWAQQKAKAPSAEITPVSRIEPEPQPTTPIPEVEAKEVGREALAQKASKILFNPHLTEEQVSAMVEQMRSMALNLLGF